MKCWVRQIWVNHITSRLWCGTLFNPPPPGISQHAPLLWTRKALAWTFSRLQFCNLCQLHNVPTCLQIYKNLSTLLKDSETMPACFSSTAATSMIWRRASTQRASWRRSNICTPETSSTGTSNQRTCYSTPRVTSNWQVPHDRSPLFVKKTSKKSFKGRTWLLARNVQTSASRRGMQPPHTRVRFLRRTGAVPWLSIHLRSWRRLISGSRKRSGLVEKRGRSAAHLSTWHQKSSSTRGTTTPSTTGRWGSSCSSFSLAGATRSASARHQQGRDPRGKKTRVETPVTLRFPNQICWRNAQMHAEQIRSFWLATCNLPFSVHPSSAQTQWKRTTSSWRGSTWSSSLRKSRALRTTSSKSCAATAPQSGSATADTASRTSKNTSRCCPSSCTCTLSLPQGKPTNCQQRTCTGTRLLQTTTLTTHTKNLDAYEDNPSSGGCAKHVVSPSEIRMPIATCALFCQHGRSTWYLHVDGRQNLDPPRIHWPQPPLQFTGGSKVSTGKACDRKTPLLPSFRRQACTILPSHDLHLTCSHVPRHFCPSLISTLSLSCAGERSDRLQQLWQLFQRPRNSSRWNVRMGCRLLRKASSSGQKGWRSLEISHSACKAVQSGCHDNLQIWTFNCWLLSRLCWRSRFIISRCTLIQNWTMQPHTFHIKLMLKSDSPTERELSRYRRNT